jgi:hypothetical protein
MSVNVLEREMFSEAEAARLLRVPQNTLNYWLEGGVRRGKTYRPGHQLEVLMCQWRNVEALLGGH